MSYKKLLKLYNILNKHSINIFSEWQEVLKEHWEDERLRKT